MNSTRRTLLVVTLLLLAAGAALSSGGQVQVFGIISKVVMEPNDRAPERIQIWGTFTLSEGGPGTRHIY